MEIVLGTEMEIGKNIRSIFPSPGGGMSKDRLTDMVNTYGREVVFLIGGALHRSKDGLTKSCTELIHRAPQKILTGVILDSSRNSRTPSSPATTNI